MYSAEVERLAEKFWTDSNPHLGQDAAKFAREMLDEQRATESFDLVAASVPFTLEGRALLEIGAGLGTFQLVARKRGVRSFGVEPGIVGASAGMQRFRDEGVGPGPLICAVGELLPFPDEVFDVVCSFQVLEHTREPQQVMSETVRVLRPGGCFVHVFPNYGSFWEGHYGVPWFPHMPKAIGRRYIRLLGKDLTMLEELQLLTHGGVERLLRSFPRVRVTSWGIKLWEHRLRSLEFSDWAYLGRLRQMVRLVHRLRLVGLLVYLGKLCHFETPIVLVGIKEQ